MNKFDRDVKEFLCTSRLRDFGHDNPRRIKRDLANCSFLNPEQGNVLAFEFNYLAIFRWAAAKVEPVLKSEQGCFRTHDTGSTGHIGLKDTPGVIHRARLLPKQ